MRAAAELRMAMAADVLVSELVTIATNKRIAPAQRLVAIKEGLERNQLYATGVTPPHARSGNLTVNTQVNTNVSAMSDVDLERYEKLLRELRELLPDQPKVLEGAVVR